MFREGNYLNYMSFGLAHETFVCLYNFCVMEKKMKQLMGMISNMAAHLL